MERLVAVVVRELSAPHLYLEPFLPVCNFIHPRQTRLGVRAPRPQAVGIVLALGCLAQVLYAVVARVAVQEAKLSEISTKVGTEYKVSTIASSAAKEMNDEVVVAIKYKGTTVLTKAMSVRAYAEDWLERESTTEKNRDLLKALLDYGAYSQLVFNYETDNLANSTYTTGQVPTTEVPAFTETVEGTVTDITGYSPSLTLESTTALNVYFKRGDGASEEDMATYTFKIDGEEVSAEYYPAWKEYKVTLPGIWVTDLHKTHVFTVTKGDETYTVTIAPLAYAYNHRADTNEKLANVCKAIYLYHTAAVAYFGK